MLSKYFIKNYISYYNIYWQYRKKIYQIPMIINKNRIMANKNSISEKSINISKPKRR